MQKKITFFWVFFLCFTVHVVAQTYPGGVSPSNMTVWLRAETGWTPSSWTNQAPVTPTGSNAFTSIGLYAPSGSQPILNPLLSNFNFNPAVQLANNGYQLDGNGLTSFYSSATSNTAQVTYFGVSDVAGFDLISNIYSNVTAAPCGNNRCNSGFRYNNVQFGNSSVSANYPTTQINNIGAGQRINDTNRSSFINGLKTNTTGSASLLNSGTYSFAVGTWGNGAYFVNGKSIPEIIWYKTALSDSDLNKVNSYLALKYGVTLSTSATAAQNYTASDGTVFWNATTATTAYRYNIFGLGRDDNSAGIHQRISHSVNNSGTTTTAGQYLKVSTNNNFTSQNTSVNHPDISNDLQFIMYADNGGDYTDYSTPFSSPSITGIGKRSSRIWQAQDTKGFGVLHYQFNSIPGGHSNYYIAKSDDPSFTSNVTVTPITLTGDTAEIQMDLNNQGTNNGVTYFTLVVTDMPPCSGIDSDGDGIADSCDLDDDNDGILDANECPLSADLITNGTFINSSAWSANNWVVGSSYTYAYITSDSNTPNTNILTQTINGLIPGSVTLNFSTLFFNGGNQEKLDVYLGNIKYASFVSSAGNGNVTVTPENGATVNMTSFPESSSWSDSNWKNIQITFPYTSTESTQVLKFDAYTTGSGDGDDIGIDDVSLNIQGCDTDGDGIPNALDLDSDGDGCYDAIEGGDKVIATQLNGNGSINSTVDAQGVPVLVNPGGLADSDNVQGQSVGGAIDPALNLCTDSDGDGIPDVDDKDDDNDGILDINELACLNLNTIQPTSTGAIVTYPNTGIPSFASTYTVSGNSSAAYTYTTNMFGYSGTAVAVNTNSGNPTITADFNRPVYNLDLALDDVDNNETATLYLYDKNGNLLTGSNVSNYITYMGDLQSVSYPNDRSIVVTGKNGNLTNQTGAVRITYTGDMEISRIVYTQIVGGSAANNGLFLMHGCVDKDTDGDGIWDRLDLDSDNDGCLDALEGDENVTNSQLVNAGGTVTAGIGSTASNQNLCANNSCVDSQGVPTVVNAGGAADIGGDAGQGIGDSQNAAVKACDAYCYKPGATATAGNPAVISKVGITSLDRSQAQADNWPAVRNGAWLVLEAKTKGFVPNRIAFDGTGNPIGINPAHFTEGMMVYDTTNKCLKMYTTKDGSNFGWYCITTQTCPD